jgi:hypothetical protein
MTCSEVQEVLPEMLDVPVNGLFPPDFQSHLKTCADCSDLVSDLRSITEEAGTLVANDEPSPMLWSRIAAQLRSEGLIRDQKSDFQARGNLKPSLVRNSPRPRWRFSWLVPVAAMLLVAGTYIAKHQKNSSISQNESVPSPVPAAKAPNSNPTVASSTPPTTAPPERAAAAKAASATTPEQVAQRRRDVEAAPSADDEQFMSVVSSRAPSMKTTYEKQLQAVNADILESQAYVDQNPADADARQHLMEAYQQKALLYQLALDRIQ